MDNKNKSIEVIKDGSKDIAKDIASSQIEYNRGDVVEFLDKSKLDTNQRNYAARRGRIISKEPCHNNSYYYEVLVLANDLGQRYNKNIGCYARRIKLAKNNPVEPIA